MKNKAFSLFYSSCYILRLDKNDEIINSLKQFAVKKKLNKGAFFYGLGVGKDIELGYFDAHKKTYIKKLFKGEYEFSSLSGNISNFEKDIIIHCHVTITDNKFNAYGGHLFRGTVPATCEIVVFPFRSFYSLNRKKDGETGLNLLNI
jgi:uncharacterized protein